MDSSTQIWVCKADTWVSGVRYRLGAMKRAAKQPKKPGFMRSVVAENVRALLAHHYPQISTITARQKKAEEEKRIPFTTLQRVCNAANGGNLETLEEIAVAFDLSLYQLVLPDLDVKNPQVVAGASKAEQAAYKRWQRAGLLGHRETTAA